MYAITAEQPGGPDVLAWTEYPDPRPGEGELLVRVVAAGVNRADLLQRQGHYPPPKGASPIIGLEVSGRVETVGPGVQGWRAGQECVALLSGGGYAERVAVPAGQVLPPPDGLDLIDAGALLEVAATVVSMTDRTGLGPGRSFLVHGGAGGIGSFAIQYARALGARVLATAGTEEKRAWCRELGADEAIDYHGDWVSAVREATGGHGADVVLDVMGASYLASNVAALAPDGHLQVIGFQGGRRGEIDLAALLARRTSLYVASLRGRPAEQKAAICRRVAEVVWPMVADGRVRLPRVARLPMPQAARAHTLLESGGHSGKLVLVAP